MAVKTQKVEEPRTIYVFHANGDMSARVIPVPEWVTTHVPPKKRKKRKVRK